MNPKITVITATYNASATLEQMILSVINQSYNNIELIIIDGKSTDGTLKVIEKYKESVSYFISERDEGIYDALNKGIAAAKGDWLYFLGADDILYNSEVVQKIFANRTFGDIRFIYGNTRLKSNHKILGGTRTYAGLIRQNISHQAIFYHKTLFSELGSFNLKYRILADYDFNLQVFRSGKIQTKFIDTDICLFNDKGGASNIIIDSSFFDDKLHYFINVEKYRVDDPALQQYNFYYGVTLLLKYKKIKGLRYSFRSFIAGSRKLFYILVFMKFMLGKIGLLKKIKFV